MLRQIVLITFDFFALTFALLASYSLGYSFIVWPSTLELATLTLAAPATSIPIFVRFGLYRAVLRYLPERAVWTILQAMTISTLLWILVAFGLETAGGGIVPRSVPAMYLALGAVLIGGSRFAVKKLLWTEMPRLRSDRPVLIYGAGEAGVMLANALRRQNSRSLVGFLDDSLALQGRDVSGLRVFAANEMVDLVAQHGVREVILSIPSLGSRRRQEIIAELSQHGVKIRALPHLADLIGGKYLVSQIREIDIDELLGRSSVPADDILVQKMIEGRTIMVTGAGGSIGSELCRLIVKWAPQRLILFESNEYALYQIERELSALKDRSIVPILGSVTERSLLEHAVHHYGVQVIFHAAAHKHVPLVEANALEGIRNNVFGTYNVAQVALECGVQILVLISSDKAVRPTNVMGATKRWAELIIGNAQRRANQRHSKQLFSSVRFGNVLGSNGSVVPLFKEQIAQGGPVTLTDPGMTRYFMSIHEAAELIVQAGALSHGGDVLLLEMGEPILIRDLAENMIRLAGFSVRSPESPDGDIEIVVTGKRPGEKMYEELFYDENNAQETKHPKIMRTGSMAAPDVDIDSALAIMKAALEARDEPRCRQILFNLIRE
jgi:FlaA1/EpsC-like NDP-sugar epimerase